MGKTFKDSLSKNDKASAKKKRAEVVRDKKQERKLKSYYDNQE